MRLSETLIRTAVGFLVLVTALSAIESDEWWIRIWDFPRVQILVALILAAVLALWRDRAGRMLALLCAIAAAWQIYRIYPYTPLATPEIAIARMEDVSEARCFDILSLNVLQTNRDYARTARLIDRVRPDILLLMETDTRWVRGLAQQIGRYPNRIGRPLGNTYGMIFATHLPMRQAEVRTITRGDTPSIHAELVAGVPFRLVALHPRPPRPGQDTEPRDAEIALAARAAARARLPVLATGDFNDVAWSHTSRLFKRVGGYVDPRIGRGTYATFPAWLPVPGWPLDHLFVTPEFRVRSMQVLEGVGSDHLPIHAEVCLTPERSEDARAAPISPEDLRDTREVLDDFRGERRQR